MLCHDIGGHDRATGQARHARQALGAHDRGTHATGEFCHDRELSVATDLDSGEKKKKKKDPRDFGHHKNYIPIGLHFHI